MKTLENKSIVQNFLRENTNISKHNKTMLEIIINKNESFTSRDIIEAHEKFDLN